MKSQRFHWITAATAVLATLGAALTLSIAPAAAGHGQGCGELAAAPACATSLPTRT